MSTAKRMTGLGRGLGALIPQRVPSAEAETQNAPVAQAPVPQGPYRQVKLSDIVPNPEQPRTVFKQQELEDLMHSIKEHGVLQPLTVTEREGGGYELIAGERRFRASKLAGLETVPVIIRAADTNEKLVVALIENIQREDLNPLEEAKGYERLANEFRMTQEEISARVGKARSTVANMMRLLDLPTEVRDAIAAGIVSAGSARAMLALPDDAARLAFFHRIVAAGSTMSTRDVEAGVRKAVGRESRKEPALLAVEEQLRSALGTRVEVKKKNGEGAIIISFYSDEEYENTVNKLLR